MSEVHPVTLEVVRNAVLSIAEEMRVILMRSARSPVLKEAGDLSCALTDAQGRLIAQGKDIPIHLGVMAFTVKEFLKRVPASRLQPGDVYFVNLPDCGGNHLPDVKAIMPVFFRDQLVAFAISLAHWPDVGGGVPGSYVPYATEIYQEGLQIPPTRLFVGGKPHRETLDLVLANVRGAEEREGDIFAQFATNEVAARRLLEVFDHYGAPTVLACFDRFFAESEAQMRAGIATLPDGVYHGEDYLDDDGVGDLPIKIAVTVTIRGDEIAFDFSGSDPQARGPINTTRFVTGSSVFYATRAIAGPNIAANDGCYRPITFQVPAGTVLNATPTASVVGGNHETSQRIVDAIFKALAPAVPDRIRAGGITTSGLALIAGVRPDGRPFFLYEVHGGGEGGSATRDGESGIRVYMSNVMNTPIEVIEAEYPLRVERHELRPDSAGQGAHRGGFGQRRAYRVTGGEAKLTTMIERCREAPWGIFGGQSGQPSRVTLQRNGASQAVRGKQTLDLRVDDLIVVETAGGGGYGRPEERPAELRNRDHREGLVSS